MQIFSKWNFRFFVALLLQVALHVCAYATKDPESTHPLLGSLGSVKVDSFRVSSDDAWFSRVADPSISPSIVPNTTHINNLVSVGIEEDSKIFIQSDFTATLVLHIAKYNEASTITAEFDSTFTVNYAKAEGAVYNASARLQFENAYRVEVKIVSIDPHGTTAWDVSRVLRVDNILQASRDYVFDCAKTISDLNTFLDVVNGELTASWDDPKNGQTEYDLEWAWIDESAITGYQDNGQFIQDKIFVNNATRVTISGVTYNIPMLYDGDGSIFVRVRPAQIKTNGQRVEGAWTWKNGDKPVAYSFNGHQNNLNWQASTSFAEEGKRKSVVQYFDGTLRNRQTVTKDNNTGTTVVAESFYDYQGRPVIQVLPAPTINTIIQYAQNFNQFANFTGYPKAAYDQLDAGATICANPAKPLSTTTGTANYYSPANPLINDNNGEYSENKYIPNSEGAVSGEAYPFTETRFAADGRIASQSGVGATFQIGSSHETKYYYESVYQEELDALFGTDAGIASHYFKNVVRDANGQYSVSYTDMHGRTVATALAGDAPKNADNSNMLEPLESFNTKVTTKQLIDNETNHILGKSIISSKSLVVTRKGDYDFKYELKPEQLTLLTCTPGNEICYDCIYNLKITIDADCNGTQGFPFTVVDSNFTMGGLLTDPTCNSNGKTSGFFTRSFIKNLPEGAYTITKTLSLSDSAQNIYRDVFFKNDTCKKFEDFYNESYQVLASQSNCNITCGACDSAIGKDFATFKDNFIAQTKMREPFSDSLVNALKAAYKEARTNCDRICNVYNSDGLEATRSIMGEMLRDVSPADGQYANISNVDDYSIFNATPAWSQVFTLQGAGFEDPQSYEWNSEGVPDPHYKNELGINDNPVYNPESTLSREEQFSDQFKTSWALQLLPHHPEYCKLKVTMEQSPSAYAFGAKLNSLTTWSSMVNATTAPGQLIINILANDPFFTGAGSAYSGLMQNRLDNFMPLSSPGTVTCQPFDAGVFATLWQLAQSSVFCRNKNTGGCQNSEQTQCLLATPVVPSVNPAIGCAQDWDLVWQFYRTTYLTERNKFIAQYLNTQCPVKNEALLAAGHTPRFVDYNNISGIGNSDNADIQGFFDQLAAGDAASVNTGHNLLADQYDSTCRGYASSWIAQLSQCNLLSERWQIQATKSADSSWLVDRLRDVCKNGADENHYFGSSGINPANLSKTTFNFSDFPAVIHAFFIDRGINTTPTAECNPYLITIPQPYEKQQRLVDMVVITKPTDCECTQIGKIHAEYTNAAYGGTFSDYMHQRYQVAISDSALNTLMSLCDGSYQCIFLPKPVTLPAAFQCANDGIPLSDNTCINCLQFHTIKDSFELLYNHTALNTDPQSQEDIDWNNAFQNFANYKTGFNKSVREYLDFADSCAAIGMYRNTNGSLTFIKTYSSSSNSASRTDVFYDMKRTPDGGYISVGITKKNSENNDGLVVKKDKYGNVLWAKKFGGAGEDDLNRITLTSDGGCIVIGNTSSYRSVAEIWLIKLSANGSEQWSKRYNAGTTHGEIGRGIIQTSDGGYALISEYDFAPDSADWTVLKLDNTGNVTWAKRFGSNSSDNAGSLIQDGDSLLVSALAYSTAIYPTIPFSYYNGVVMKIGVNDGSVGWIKTYDIDVKSNWFFDLYKTDSGYILNSTIGDDWYANNPHSTMIRINKNGDVKKVVKVNSYSTSSSGYLSIFPTQDDGFISVQDDNSTTSDVYLQKTDSAGNPVWANRISIPGIQKVSKIFENPDGSFTADGFSDTSTLLIKTDILGQTGCNDSSVTITNTLSAYTAVSPTLAYNSTISISENSLADSGSILPLKTTTFCSSSPDNGPHLCDGAIPVFEKLTYTPEPCKDLDKMAYTAAEEKWELYTDSVRNVFDTAYYNKCMSAKNLESFTVTYQTSEYHYTLYYYDQAGNLLKTVPPAGIDDKHGDAIFLAQVKAARADELINGSSAVNSKIPNHTLVTRYRYNTLNQVTAQQTPDAGVSNFWYDALGRLVVSQNAKQILTNRYSYTQYDQLGRITEVGQKPKPNGGNMNQNITRNPERLGNWLNNNKDKEQITRTVYDVSYYAGEQPATLEPTLYQSHLRNRVSYTQVFNIEPPGNDANKWSGTHTAATFYSYDIHGNVDTLLQDYNFGAMAAAGNRFKKMVYDYDLISGKVNEVAYQPRMPDAFYHRYSYDAENRLTDVETSTDNFVWEHDARYFYYKHGPLARTILGQNQVQGIDYAYTLQGWLKGVNSTSVGDGSFDIGGDGKAGSSNSNIARDVFGFSLNYFSNDYNPIDGTNPFVAIAVANDLFNGNINAMAVNIPKLGDAKVYGYKYDQLNRLVAMDAYNGLNNATNVFTPVTINDYKERISYDANGNIKTYLRNGNAARLSMDDLTYTYKPNTDQLDKVVDTSPDAALGEYDKYNDIKQGHANGNYQYDAIGNLISDVSEKISNITWTVYGKINAITKTDGTNISYTYDASGNRISKTVNSKATFYVRDASGNVMSIYNKDATINNNHLTQSEIHLYGSSRLGIYNLTNDVEYPDLKAGRIFTFSRGNKFFELSNHLENVLATVSDKKVGFVTNSDGVIDYFTADVVSAQDFYPFGMLMPSRKYSIANTNYRYGFNGKENDKDIENAAQDYGMRIYDGRLGRFLSVDPITKKYPELTPYQFASNRPVDGIDLDGLEYTPKGRYGPNQIAVDGSAVSTYSRNPAIIEQTSAQIQFERKQQYFSTPSNNYVSPAQQNIYNTRTNDAGYNLDGAKKGWVKLAENKTAENFANNIVFPMIEMAGTMDGLAGAYQIVVKTLLKKRFASGATKLVSSEMLEAYMSSSTFGNPSNTFVSPTSEIDALLNKGYTREKLAKTLGITDKRFLKGDLIRIDVSPEALKSLNLRPTVGNEVGANEAYIKGNKTVGGVTEAIVNGIPKDANGVSKKIIR